MDVKEYPTSLFEKYTKISDGEIRVDLNNFNDVYSILPRGDEMMINRNRVGLSLVYLMEKEFTGFKLKKNNITTFIERPIEIDLRFGGDLQEVFKLNQDLMSLINKLFGHYRVAIQLLEFLYERENFLTKQINAESVKLAQKGLLITKAEEEKLSENQQKTVIELDSTVLK